MQRTCQMCGRDFEAKRRDARTCSATCRSNKRNSVRPPDPAVVAKNSLVKATTSELEAAGKVDTMLGQLAISLAGRMSGTTTGLAALSRELRSVLDAALGAQVASSDSGAGDSVDELRARRNAKRAG